MSIDVEEWRSEKIRHQVDPYQGQVLQTCRDYRVIELNRKRGLYRLLFHDFPGTGQCEYLTMTGGADYLYWNIPTEHRIRKVGWVHTDASFVPSTLQIAYSFNAYVWGRTALTVPSMVYDYHSGLTSSYMTEFGDVWEEPNQDYVAAFTTTEGHYIFYWMDVQTVGEGK